MLVPRYPIPLLLFPNPPSGFSGTPILLYSHPFLEISFQPPGPNGNQASVETIPSAQQEIILSVIFQVPLSQEVGVEKYFPYSLLFHPSHFSASPFPRTLVPLKYTPTKSLPTSPKAYTYLQTNLPVIVDFDSRDSLYSASTLCQHSCDLTSRGQTSVLWLLSYLNSSPPNVFSSTATQPPTHTALSSPPPISDTLTSGIPPWAPTPFPPAL